MLNRRNIRFLTTHFGNLQGLRLAPLWVIGMATPWLVSLHDPKRNLVMLYSSILVAFLGNLLLGRYYRNQYGWVKAHILRKNHNRGLLLLLCGTMLAFCLYLLRSSLAGSSLRELPFAVFIPLYMGWNLAWVGLAKDNLPLRRMYYISALLLCIFIGICAAEGYSFFSLRNTMILTFALPLAVSLFDHCLLISLLSHIRKETHA
jgi:hypothetical protein